jgi:molecular chaperone HtpG
MPPVLEVNPTHPLITALHARLGEDGKPVDPDAMADIAGSLLDLARVQEGDLPRDPSDFARRITALLAGRLEAA